MINDDSVPVFSIITVCYNSAKTIERTIQSVFDQTFSNYEYIIIDGKSTDDTISILRKYEAMFEGKLKIISEKDNGIYDAMNKGIKLAKGIMVGIINSDDWYEKNTCEIINKKISPNYDSIVYGLMRYYRLGKEFQIKSYNHEFLNEKMINHPTCFIPKQIYNSVGVFDTKYKLAADYEFILRCKKNKSNFIHIPAILANMSMEGASAKNHYRSRKETYEILYKYKHISYLYKISRLIDLRLKMLVKKIFSFN